MSDRLNNASQFNKILMERFVAKGNVCVDATAGNGYDTCRLANLVGEEGEVYSFDVQDDAILRTRDLLTGEGLQGRVKLIQDTHENIDIHIPGEVDFLIYNLGYLPGGDKPIKTESHTTISSVEKALKIMKHGAIILVTAYRGHQGGLEEYRSVKKYFEGLPQNSYNVFEFSFINQKNDPPITIGLEVRGGRTWQR
ncbi:tRNA (mnm(5)s(2)U34)-methyltransferase [Gudongella sp. SC589]|uniref:tRNA (mnm(5)s(2)U34)-methyltransferase n=1 Tax=Gudongella sp. SC589 TaxID=3385990 RepID=UPI003904D46B